MLYRPELTPAQHVARREALAQVARGAELSDGLTSLIDNIVAPVAQQYLGDRRIDERGFEALVRDTRAHLASFGPAMMIENRRPPTRARPKGEEHEFLLAMRAGSEPDRNPTAYELAGVRVALTRRRILIGLEPNGVLVTKHALERSIERGIASWTGRMAEVEDAMLDRLGLACVWRHAFELGRITSQEAALPCRDDLILCILDRNPERRGAAMVTGSSMRMDCRMETPGPFVVHPQTHAADACISVILATVVNEELLDLCQIDMRDALTRFCDRHGDFLNDLTTSILWRSATVAPLKPIDDLATRLDIVSEELAALVRLPWFQEALQIRRRPQPPHALAPGAVLVAAERLANPEQGI